MSTILTIRKARTFRGYWLTLSCEHRIKWTGKRPAVGASIECPNHKPLVIYDTPAAPAQEHTK